MADVVDVAKIEGKFVDESGATGLEFKALYGPAAGRRLNANYVTIMEGGVSKAHKHEWDQFNYIISGEGVLKTDGGSCIPVKTGMAVYIYGQEMHWYENKGSIPMSVIGILGPMPQG